METIIPGLERQCETGQKCVGHVSPGPLSLAQAQGWGAFVMLFCHLLSSSTCQYQKTLLTPFYFQAFLKFSQWSSSPFFQGPVSHARPER